MKTYGYSPELRRRLLDSLWTLATSHDRERLGGLTEADSGMLYDCMLDLEDLVDSRDVGSRLGIVIFAEEVEAFRTLNGFLDEPSIVLNGSLERTVATVRSQVWWHVVVACYYCINTMLERGVPGLPKSPEEAETTA